MYRYDRYTTGTSIKNAYKVKKIVHLKAADQKHSASNMEYDLTTWFLLATCDKWCKILYTELSYNAFKQTWIEEMLG
jgi:hypothetical protein